MSAKGIREVPQVSERAASLLALIPESGYSFAAYKALVWNRAGCGKRLFLTPEGSTLFTAHFAQGEGAYTSNDPYKEIII